MRRRSVQAVHVGLEAIERDVVQLAGGQQRAVLEVSSLNFTLQGGRQQEAIVAGFAAFLNSLSFPIQILSRVLPVDVDGYLTDLEWGARQLPEGLAQLAHDHAAFLRQLARRRTLLERRFYVVIPAQTNAHPSGSRRLFHRHPGEVRVDVTQQLTTRCEEVERQLGRCGLSARRLSDGELAQLFYACWCPELARVQRLQRDLSRYKGLVVHARHSREGRS